MCIRDRTYHMAELYGRRISAVFSAYSQVDVGAHCFALFNSHLHKLAYALSVYLCRRVALIDNCLLYTSFRNNVRCHAFFYSLYLYDL